MRVAFATLGCKVNQDETAGMEELFRQAGWQLVKFGQQADVYIVNTCTVTHLGSRKSRQLLRQARRRNPRALVVALGCYPQAAPEELRNLQEVDLIVGNSHKPEIVALVEQALAGEHSRVLVDEAVGFQELPAAGPTHRHRAFLKIQEGCRRYCTYCIVPLARGGLRSMPPDEVVAKAQALAAKGYKEIVLTGINLTSYGRETGGYNLAGAIRSLNNQVAARIRISSVEPTDFDDELLEAVTENPGICRHFHIPLQSGSDGILEAMGRKYTADRYLALVDRLRQEFDAPSFSTDIIVGFPGETEKDFAATMDVVRRAAFCRLHVFRYSPRPGTPAARFGGRVDAQTCSERSARLIELGREVAAAYAAGLVGRREQLLTEEASGLIDGGVSGYGQRYVRIHCQADLPPGRLVTVKITASRGSDLLAVEV